MTVVWNYPTRILFGENAAARDRARGAQRSVARAR